MSLEGIEDLPSILSAYFDVTQGMAQQILRQYFESIVDEIVDTGHATISFGSFDWNEKKKRVEFTYHAPEDQEDYLDIINELNQESRLPEVD